ncbi:MAG: hypothetical protein KC563_00680 [Nitrospira sp.]|nr:hypothetical protein [Nitrospira sp.]MCB9711099.1 hypothetical protein [Nitrospiraceae bacterium]MDR4488380.1 hypothetical protein [Nitrospirales bacterium]MCA9466406.1 hypothetical protein [Nitrospira sp.]MCA9474317.1 hypothetical protein [Nitrospira sp.]
MELLSQVVLGALRKIVWSIVSIIFLFGDFEMASGTVVPHGPTFDTQPISCEEYLKQKRKSKRPDSFFQAKVQIIGLPLSSKYPSMRMVMVEVAEVLEGQVPAKEFPVEYHVDFGDSGLPYEHEESKFYYIMGGVALNQEIILSRPMERFPKPGTRKNVVLQWLTQWFSDCKSVW